MARCNPTPKRHLKPLMPMVICGLARFKRIVLADQRGCLARPIRNEAISCSSDNAASFSNRVSALQHAAMRLIIQLCRTKPASRRSPIPSSAAIHLLTLVIISASGLIIAV